MLTFVILGTVNVTVHVSFGTMREAPGQQSHRVMNFLHDDFNNLHATYAKISNAREHLSLGICIIREKLLSNSRSSRI
jgi:hypothetical protein